MNYIFDDANDQIVDGPYHMEENAKAIMLALRLKQPGLQLSIKTRDELLDLGHTPGPFKTPLIKRAGPIGRA